MINCICGRKVHCKQLCLKCYKKEYYIKNKKKILGYQIKYRDNNKEIIKEKGRMYRLKNKPYINKKAKQYYIENSDKIKKYQKKYWSSARGREIDSIKWRKRRANKYNVIEVYTQEDWGNILINSNGICKSCEVFIGVYNLELDHIYPISRAYYGQIYNVFDIQPLCRSCNSRKGNGMEIDKYEEYRIC